MFSRNKETFLPLKLTAHMFKLCSNSWPLQKSHHNYSSVYWMYLIKNTTVLSSVFSRTSCQTSNYSSSYSSDRPMASFENYFYCVDSEFFQDLKAKCLLGAWYTELKVCVGHLYLEVFFMKDYMQVADT